MLLAVQATAATYAQGWRRRMLEQIAALQVQLGYVKKGYGILKNGTGLISDFKHGEFSLHRNFFDSLMVVSPAIRNSKRIPDILALYDNMEKRRQALLVLCSGERLLLPAEQHTIKFLLTDLSERADAEVGELELTLTNGKLKLSDDERLHEIERCYDRMHSMNSYQKGLQGRLISLLRLRGKAFLDTRLLRRLYGLENQ